MTDVETLEERVRTVERALTDGEPDVPAVENRTELAARLTAVEDRLEDLDERASELEAATQALRGYVGNVRSVNEAVERRADSALAATERLERRLDGTTDGERAAAESEPARARDGGQSAATQPASTGTPRTAPTETGSPTTADHTSPPVENAATDDQSTPDGGVLERIRALL